MVLELLLAATVQSGAVSVSYASDRAEAERVAAALERARQALPAITGARDASISAEIADSVDAFCARTRLPRTAGAGVIEGQIVFSPVTARLEDLDELARHEVAHLIVLEHAKPGLPRWFAEGLAAELAGESPRGDAPCRAMEPFVMSTGTYAVAQRAVRAAARAQGGLEALWRAIDRAQSSQPRFDRYLRAECEK